MTRRRVGVLVNPSADDPETKARTKAFLQGMQELGWIDGRNMRVDIRWEVGFENRFRCVAGYVDPQGRKAGRLAGTGPNQLP